MKKSTIGSLPLLSPDLAPGVAKELQTLREEINLALASAERATGMPPGVAFPDPTEEWEGVILLSRLLGGANQARICLRNGDGTYGWQTLAQGNP